RLAPEIAALILREIAAHIPGVVVDVVPAVGRARSRGEVSRVALRARELEEELKKPSLADRTVVSGRRPVNGVVSNEMVWVVATDVPAHVQEHPMARLRRRVDDGIRP